MGEQEEEPHPQRPTLPPGCRFHPSEELLLGYYLTNKNNNPNETGNRDGGFYGSNLIRELDLYGHDPFELPDTGSFSYGSGGRKRHWYCYTVRALNEGIWRGYRKVKSGFWVRKGSARNVLGTGGRGGGAAAGNGVLGTRTRFVFYVGNTPKNAVRTDWILYEYALVDHLLASFVLCRVFVKARHKNSASEIGLSSCAEESVSAVRHIGIQHDGNVLSSDAVEVKACDDCSIDKKNEIPVRPLRCASGQDDLQVMTAPVAVATFQCSVGPQGSQQEKLSGLPGSSAMFIDPVTSQQHLLSVLDDGFIELDDLDELVG